MSLVRFEPTIPVFEREKTVHALDRAAPVICTSLLIYDLSCQILTGSGYLPSNDWWIIGRNIGGNTFRLCWDSILAFALRDWGKPRNTSGYMSAGLQAQTWTRDFPTLKLPIRLLHSVLHENTAQRYEPSELGMHFLPICHSFINGTTTLYWALASSSVS
jgi:hypothetical protein